MTETEKSDIKGSFCQIRDTWKTEITKTIQFVAKNFEEPDEPEPSASQNEEPVIICGRVIPSDLPKGARLNVDDELSRYKQITASEFTACKSYYSKYYDHKKIPV